MRIFLFAIVILLILISFRVEDTSAQISAPAQNDAQSLKQQNPPKEKNWGLLTGIAGIIAAVASLVTAIPALWNAKSANKKATALRDDLYRLIMTPEKLYKYGLFEHCLGNILHDEESRKRFLKDLMMSFHEEPEQLAKLKTYLEEKSNFDQRITGSPDEVNNLLKDINTALGTLVNRG